MPGLEPGISCQGDPRVKPGDDGGRRMPWPAMRESGRRDFASLTFGVITLDPALLDDTIDRVTIRLPRRVLKRLDALARAA